MCDVTQLGTGDQVMVYAGADAIKRVGIWDERFAFMHHDSDYFHRLRVHLPDRSCVHDYAIRRVHRPIFGSTANTTSTVSSHGAGLREMYRA